MEFQGLDNPRENNNLLLISIHIATQVHISAMKSNQNESNQAQATRKAPESVICKILDHLMFYNSGKACAFTRGKHSFSITFFLTFTFFCDWSMSLEFIDGHLKEGSNSDCYEKVSSRFKFYELATFLTSNKDWSSTVMENVLHCIIRLVSEMSRFVLCKQSYILNW